MTTLPPPINDPRELAARTRDGVATLLDLLRRADASSSREERVRLDAAVAGQAKILRDAVKGPVFIVVAREQPARAEQLKRAFAHDPEVDVIVDRRRGDRRQSTVGRSVERRRRQRRQLRIEEDLTQIGAVLVRRATPFRSGSPEHAARHQRAGVSASRILLIDDDPGVIDMLRTFLEASKSGYLVDTALSGEAGLAAVAERRPDVVLLDLRMPGLDGLEVIKRIRAIDPSIPVIMVTSASYQETSQALKSGAFAYIAKPFELRYIEHLLKLATEHAPAPGR
jgi:CheY-like chemotaxis protein